MNPKEQLAARPARSSFIDVRPRVAPSSRALRSLGALGVALLLMSAASCAEDTVPDSTTAGGAGGTGGAGTGATGGGAGTGGTTGTGGASDGGGSGGSTGSGGSGQGGAAGAGGASGGTGGATGGTGGATGGTGGATGGTGGATGGSAGSGTAGAAGSGAGGTATDGGGQGGSAGTGGAAGSGMVDAGSDAPRSRDPECDLNGRWLLTQRNLLSLPALQCQATHTWYYYEVRHDGEGFTVTKGLHCGYESVKKSSQSANVVNMEMWPAMLANVSSAGRTGTFVKQADKCHLTLPVEYVIRGATVSHYRDPANPLPVMGSAAAGPGGMPPGWEDWDNDSNPGFSLNINSPLAKGTLYLATRDTNAIDNVTPLSSAVFKVLMTFTTLQATLGTAPGSSPLITSGGTPWDGPDSHFTYFMKLQDG
ncbi:MAG TPA: hypothetical protein VK550_35400, partial [Polyangiaceae bacterium]|nr:hypothetical protein [Polyangiaceae bacterium]